MSDEIFSVNNIQWKEFPGDVLTDNLNELVMIHHSPLYTPESRKMGEPKLHTCVFNIETGRFKRIPFPDGDIMFGSFSPDRKKVYASGIDVTIPQWDIFEIDLQGGEIRNLTAGMLKPGLIFFLTLSPDGNTLVFMYKGVGIKNILLSQVYLLNLKSYKLKKLGQPIDAFYFSWLPSGKGLLLRKNTYDNPGGYSRKQICRLDFDGTLTPVIEGDSPVLLANRQLILFIGTDSLWYICDLNGKNKKKYIDGLKGYGFPAQSPDGKRILWIRYETGKIPVPLICEIGKKHGIKMTTEPGLWTMPTWK